MNSDLPEPVIPATRPCGPCFFSCKSKDNKFPLASTPIGAAKVLEIGEFFHFSNIFNCSILPTPYISKKPNFVGKVPVLAASDVANLIGIFDNLSIQS